MAQLASNAELIQVLWYIGFFYCLFDCNLLLLDQPDIPVDLLFEILILLKELFNAIRSLVNLKSSLFELVDGQIFLFLNILVNYTFV